MDNTKNQNTDVLDTLYRKLYTFTDRLEQYTLDVKVSPERLKDLHFKVYRLREEIMNSWQKLFEGVPKD